MECANDINAMIDAAKFADLVLLLTDGSYGFEMVRPYHASRVMMQVVTFLHVKVIGVQEFLPPVFAQTGCLIFWNCNHFYVQKSPLELCVNYNERIYISSAPTPGTWKFWVCWCQIVMLPPMSRAFCEKLSGGQGSTKW